ncbi:MAG TPA: bifunctional trypsin-like peptidase domain-containing/SEL1-like repeat protein [Myxococcaceae bacterium]|nr:bifunctional trypsin-like peptidase domain-containing/SEL1-like repeat protein [Myxococcaceae bacterium]
MSDPRPSSTTVAVAHRLAAIFLVLQAGSSLALLATTRRSGDERLLVAVFSGIDLALSWALLRRWRGAAMALAVRAVAGAAIFGGLALLRHEPLGASLAGAAAAGMLLAAVGRPGPFRTALASVALAAVLLVEASGVWATLTGDALLALPIHRLFGWVEGPTVEAVSGKRLPYRLRLEPGHWVHATEALRADEDVDLHLVWPRRSAHLVVRAFDAPGAGGFDLAELQHRLESLLPDTEFLEAIDLGGDFERSRLIRVHSRTPDFDEDGWLGLFTRGDHGFLVSAATPSRNFPRLSESLRAAVTSFSFDLPPPPTIPVEVMEKVKRGVALVKTATGSGSGFVVDVVGGVARVLTNAHVVQHALDGGPPELGVVFTDGSVRVLQPARVVRADPEADLALLEAPVGAARPVLLLLHTARSTPVGLPLFVVGFPFGPGASATAAFPPPTVNAGRLAAEPEASGALRIDVAINPGNSGGPVVDANGAVRGVAVGHIRSSDTSFLIPAEEVGRFLGHPAWLGWSTLDPPEALPARGSESGQRELAFQATVLLEAAGRVAPGVLVPSGAGEPLVLTSASALEGSDGGAVVRLRPGFDDERTAAAALLSTDPASDLALLRLSSDGGAPEPLVLGAAGPLAETSPVDLAGFFLAAPGGRAPGHARAVVRPGALSTRKRDRSGRLVALSVEAGALPDLTGGPVLDLDGKLLGFARPRRDPSSSLFEVTSAERIADFLDGWPRGAVLQAVTDGVGHCVFRLDVDLEDPLGRIRTVGVQFQDTRLAARRDPLVLTFLPPAATQPVFQGRAVLQFQPRHCPQGVSALRLFTETERGRRTDVIHPFRLSAGPGVLEQVALGEQPPPHPAPFLPAPGWSAAECTPGDLAGCQRACKRRRPKSCYLLGAAEDARGSPELAERPYRQACDRGVAVACVALAPRVANTLGLLERACALGHGEACTRAAASAEHRDPARIASLLRRGCTLGDARACVDLADSQLTSSSPAELEAAGALLLQACQRWEVEGCLRLALLVQSGAVAPRGPLTALALLDRACALGERQGCVELQRMGLPPGGPLR